MNQESRSEEELTFAFADLAGFTALTEAHGDAEAADLIEDFCRTVRSALPTSSARGFESIGDAVMVVLSDTPAAVELGMQLTGRLLREHGWPAVRVGIHRGCAVERGGDFFGAAVNLTARVSAHAAGGEVLLTDAVRRAAGDMDGVVYVDRGPHRFRNVREEVEVFAAVPVGGPEDRRLVHDPVCRMAVDPARAAGRLEHAGSVFFFCSLRCVAAFATDPRAHLDAGSSATG